MDYQEFFAAIKERVMHDLEADIDRSLFNSLSLSMTYSQHRRGSNDQYRSKTAKVPAYYNPNSHTVHLNVNVIESADEDLVENIYYHELVHAGSHHARMSFDGMRILKSGLKIQTWNEEDEALTLHRGLNEGFTQFIANSYTNGGSAYKREVEVIGRLVKKIGLQDLKEAYFGPGIDALERKISAVLGAGVFQQLSALVDAKEYDEALALIS